VIQAHGTICAWAESDRIIEERFELSATQISELESFLGVYLPH
jgi:hypothetical protein